MGDDCISGSGAKSLSFWREEPRGAEGRKEKLNVFARLGFDEMAL
jgi:hypothetical protein